MTCFLTFTVYFLHCPFMSFWSLNVGHLLCFSLHFTHMFGSTHKAKKRSLTSLWVVDFSFLGEGFFFSTVSLRNYLFFCVSVKWLAALTLWAGLLTSKQHIFSIHSVFTIVQLLCLWTPQSRFFT
jgi:hypothetical protein